VLNDASTHLKKISDAKYEPADLNKIAHNYNYLTDNEQMQLLSLQNKYQHLFDGSLGTWNGKPYDIELKPNATLIIVDHFRSEKYMRQHFKLN
jgi:hypothetical protein